MNWDQITFDLNLPSAKTNGNCTMTIFKLSFGNLTEHQGNTA